MTETKVLGLLQQDWLGPLPLEEDQEEFLKEGEEGLDYWKEIRIVLIHLDARTINNLEKSGWGSIGIQLTHPGDQHGPTDPSQEPHHVAVDPVLLRPQLDTSQGQPEVAHIWHLRNIQ